MVKWKKVITKRAWIKIEQEDKERMSWVKVAPITAEELVQSKADRKLTLLWKLAEYKINPNKQLYIRVWLKKWYMLIWQPIDESYSPDFFIVEHEWEQYKFVKMKRQEESIFNQKENEQWKQS